MDIDDEKVSIIIPAFNEAENIGIILDRIKNVNNSWEIVVVNDGSTDDTAKIAEEKGAWVVSHPYNLGNGSSIKAGGNAATGDVLVMMDADGQHQPEDILLLIEHIGKYDMVVGARTKDSDVSGFRSIGNKALNFVAQYLVGRKIMDLTSGFRAVKKKCFAEYKHLFPQRYSYPTTITMAMFSGGYFIKYVPLESIKKREGGDSNIQPFRDGVRFVNIICRIVVLFNPMKVFLPLSVIAFIIGFGSGGYDAVVNFRLEESSLLMIILGAFLLFFGMLADQVSRIRRELHTLLNSGHSKK